MAKELSKSRRREVRARGLIPEYWVGDHLMVGRLQSQEEQGSSTSTITEQITYGVGNTFNRCHHVSTSSGFDHYTRRTVGIMLNDTWRITLFPPKGGEGKSPDCKIHRRGGVTGYKYPNDTVSVDMDPGLVELRRMQAWNKLMQLQPTRFMNAERSVMELKDSEQTLGQALTFLKWARSKMGQRLRKGRKSSIVLKLGSSLADVAAAYLWYQFGVEPTVSDIRQFYRELGQGKLRVFGELGKTHCLARKGQVLVARYSARYTPDHILDLMFGSHRPTSFAGTVNFAPPTTVTYITWPAPGLVYPEGGVPVGRRVRVRGEISGCYFAQVREDVNVSGLDNLRRHWRWNFPALKTMWDLLPFSFLVDWIVGVGETIEALEKRYLVEDYSAALGPVWRSEVSRSTIYEPIVSGSLAVQGHRVSGAQGPYDYGSALISVAAQYSYAKSHEDRNYNRIPIGAPSVVWPTLTRQISAGQITSGMALILQAAKAWMNA